MPDLPVLVRLAAGPRRHKTVEDMSNALRDAAMKLSSPVRTEREAGEAILIAARNDAVPALLAVLDFAVRQPPGTLPFSPVARAALLIGAMGAREAVPTLCRVARSGRIAKDDGAFVARALAELLDGRDAFDDDVRNALEALSTSTDIYTRAFAAEAFGALGDQRSRSRVQALAEDKEPWVKDKAHAVLRKLVDASAAAAADSFSFADFAALAQAANDEGGALKPWLDDLDDSRRPVRDNAINELVKAGRPAVPWLLKKLNQPSPRARIGAATALGRLQPPEAAAALLIAASSAGSSNDDRELRPVALRALANCLTGAEEGLAGSILPLARDQDRFTRAAALLCLGRLSDRRGMKAVVAAILEDDPFVVESAAVALSEGVREEDTELVRPLLVALAKRPTPKPAVKEAILIALSRIAIDAPALRVRARHRVRREVFGPTSSTRKAAVVLLERMYDDVDPPPLSVVDDVMSRLQDDHPEVRVCAASFIARHLEPGFSGAPRRLQQALNRGERTVSLLALEALRRHDTEASKDVLEGATKNADDVVAGRARELLENFVPSTAAWAFVPRTLTTTPTTQPGLAEVQRPRRVRVASDGDVVEAKDGPVAPTPIVTTTVVPTRRSEGDGEGPAIGDVVGAARDG